MNPPTEPENDPYIAALLLLTAATDPPKLDRRSQSTQLIVDGKPFLILGGELSNSAASSAARNRTI